MTALIAVFDALSRFAIHCGLWLRRRRGSGRDWAEIRALYVSSVAYQGYMRDATTKPERVVPTD